MPELTFYELGQNCLDHPEAALVETQVLYRYNCSECKRLSELPPSEDDTDLNF